jgi:dUTP pyrophosphatase
MKVKIKKTHEGAIIPRYAKHGDAGLDLTAIERTTDEYGNVVYRTGLAFEIPEGYVGLIFPRSSVCKYDLALTNAVAVIDSGYRGEVVCKFKPTVLDSFERDPRIYEVGERFAQMIILPYPSIEFEETEELSDSARGTGGYGSSGK